MLHIRTYERGPGLAPFEVYLDQVAHQGRGMFRVVIAGQRIGAQISYPSADDCARLLRDTSVRNAITTTAEAARRLEQARIGQARGARSIHLASRQKRAKEPA